MNETIELILESPDGIIDCRLEPIVTEAGLSYSATILYPNIVNGYSRSEIYSHVLYRDVETGDYIFETGENAIHPKIKKLEAQLSEAIIKAL